MPNRCHVASMRVFIGVLVLLYLATLGAEYAIAGLAVAACIAFAF